MCQPYIESTILSDMKSKAGDHLCTVHPKIAGQKMYTLNVSVDLKYDVLCL